MRFLYTPPVKFWRWGEGGPILALGSGYQCRGVVVWREVGFDMISMMGGIVLILWILSR